MRTRVIVGFVVIGVMCWWLFLRGDDAAEATHAATPDRDAHADVQAAGGSAAHRSHRTAAGGVSWQVDSGDGVTITGSVIDVKDHKPVGHVEVVFRSTAGESTTTAGPDGHYAIKVGAGVYRAFVRDDALLSVGRPDLVRLPGMPAADMVGMPDEGLMPLVVANADINGIDLSVLRGATVRGKVTDASGHAIAGAIIRTRGTEWRPALGSDIAETDASGAYTLHVPAGTMLLEAAHDRFAGIRHDTRAELQIDVRAGEDKRADLTLASGCIIRGKVVGPDGKPAADGAIERQYDLGDRQQFVPAGQVNPDGTFRWATTEEVAITLRAWPWKSPPSDNRTFDCKDGARFDNVVLTLPNRGPDIEGVLVDATGAPVPFGHIDLQPQDPGGIAQQERTDGEGKWAVFAMPAGHYRVIAHAPGHGIVDAIVQAPQSGVRLMLGGTGRLEGTTTALAEGSFEMSLAGCAGDNGEVGIEHEQRLVPVIGGRFAVDDLPACALSFTATWRGHPIDMSATIPAGGSTRIELDLGPPHEKLVHGTVRDGDGKPIANAAITAMMPGVEDDVQDAVHADANGRYSMKSFSGATIVASSDNAAGMAKVGRANVSDEEVDITIHPGEGAGEIDVE